MQRLRPFRICQLAATVITIYDHLITLDQEVAFVWNKRWSMSKVLLIWSRYFGDFVLLAESAVYMTTNSPKFCYMWFRFRAWGGAVVIWSMQLNMMSRIFALYPQSRKILIFVLACFISEVAASSTVLALAIRTFAVPPPFNICIPHTIPRYLYKLWIPIILFEVLLFALSLKAGLAHIRRMRGLKRLQNHDLVTVLVRDNVVYFFIIVVTYLAVTVALIVLPNVWEEIPDGLTLASTSVMGCRLMLNLREAYYLPFSRDTDSERVLSDFRTAEPIFRRRNGGMDLTPICTLEMTELRVVSKEILRTETG